jgi:DNA modification methylase
MSAGIVDMVLTSPPYWQKGDNGVEGQIGIEAHFKDYIARLVQVFGEVKRILKPTGSCFVVIDDTYNGVHLSKSNTKVKQKAGLNQEGTAGVNKQLQAGIMDSSFLQIHERFAIAMTD